jgi:hypothetical protein
MARDWEAQLREWGHAPGPAEQTKMENTESQIRAAITAHPRLKLHNVQVASQGSYYNLTHIPRESDVDIRVVSHDAVYNDWSWVDPRGNTDEAVRATLRTRFGIPSGPAPYGFSTFRDDVGEALVARFGPTPNVTPGDKAFSIKETRYHVDADVVAALEHRTYRTDGTYEEGVEFVSRKGVRIVNWPVQQHDNGVTKNKATHERFKAMVRALKNLRVEMDDQKNAAAAKPMSSFLIECLVWNVPDGKFGHATYYDDMKEVLRFLYANTKEAATCAEWREESDLKWLFKGKAAWTPAQVNAFVLAAWRHVEFKD